MKVLARIMHERKRVPEPGGAIRADAAWTGTFSAI